MNSLLARGICVCTCVSIALGAFPILPAAADSSQQAPAYQTFADLKGQVVLDNPRVNVQKFFVLPGQATGRHSHPGDQLLVFVNGGVLSSKASGRSTLWRDGRVVWQGASDAADDGSTNTGATPIELICVTLKPGSDSHSTDKRKYHYLNYPNIPGEDILENDLVIVQRFTVFPGQWEGVHEHVPNMLYIHIKGGQWAARLKGQPEHLYPAPSPDGSVGWMQPYTLDQGHESGNLGKEPIDLIWVTLKK
jgi:predicted component of type VI protein secretion system